MAGKKNSETGTSPKKKTTPNPNQQACMQFPSGDANLRHIALETARQNQGEILRYRLVKGQLVILFVDGRKYYIDLEGA